MSVTSVKVLIQQRQLRKERPEYSLRDVAEKLQEYVADVDAGTEDCPHQWQYIKTIFLRLYKKPTLSDQDRLLLAIAEPAIMKHGPYDGELSAKLDGQFFNRYQDEQD